MSALAQRERSAARAKRMARRKSRASSRSALVED
jgi:hypothetical protein